MDRSLPRLVLYGVCLVLGLTIVVAASTSSVAFGTFNPAWDGTSDFRSLAANGTETTLVQNVSAYDRQSGNDTLAVILSPAEAYGDDAAPIREFVAAGGTLLIAEDFRSNTNPLLNRLGVAARIDGRLLRDERHYNRSPELPQVTANGTDNGTYELVFNRGTVIRPNGATIHGWTHESGYLDLDRDGSLDTAETPAQRPVITTEPVVDGRVILVADPSLFINAMLDRGDNRAFAQTLLDDQDRVLFDVSHAGGVPPLVALLIAIRDLPLLQGVLGGTVLVLIARRDWLQTQFSRIIHDGRGGQELAIDPAGVTDGVQEAHPDWDPDRVQRVVETRYETPGEPPAAPEADSNDARDVRW